MLSNDNFLTHCPFCATEAHQAVFSLSSQFYSEIDPQLFLQTELFLSGLSLIFSSFTYFKIVETCSIIVMGRGGEEGEFLGVSFGEGILAHSAIDSSQLFQQTDVSCFFISCCSFTFRQLFTTYGVYMLVLDCHPLCPCHLLHPQHHHRNRRHCRHCQLFLAFSPVACYS